MSISTMRQMKQRTLYENSGYAPKNFLKILHNERNQGVKNHSIGSYEKNLCSSRMDNFRPKNMMRCCNSGSALKMFFLILQNKRS